LPELKKQDRESVQQEIEMDALKDHLDIATPENVVFGYEIAGIGSRFLAALIDTLLVTVLQVVVFLSAALVIATVGALYQDGDSTAVMWLIGILGLIGFALQWGYYVFFETRWNGQSPGKRRVGLRVIRSDGTPITLAESIIRNLLRLIDFMPAYYGVGVVTMFIDRQARRLGDLAAGTFVVHDREEIVLESLRSKPSLRFTSGETGSTPTHLPIERLTARDIEIAEDFLWRKDELPLSTATHIANRIARMLIERMDLPAGIPGAERSVNLIRQVVRAARQRELERPCTGPGPPPGAGPDRERHADAHDQHTFTSSQSGPTPPPR
jgi:uncharacterized RDD family membrane protein YckC